MNLAPTILITALLALLPFLAIAAHRQRTNLMRFFSRKRKASSDHTPREMIVQDSILLALPDEILINVIRYLEYDCLLATRAVSTHLQALAEPFIYEDYVIDHGQKSSNLASLVTANPKRAEWLRSILVSTKYDEDDGLWTFPDQLRQMRNLKHLILETPDCNAKIPMDRIGWIRLQRQYESILQSSTLAVPRKERLLPDLETCTMHLVDDRTSLYPLTRYSSIFIHPTLKALTISCACTDFPHRILNLLGEFKHCTALEDLHLEECDVDPQSLELLLELSTGIKSFKLSEATRYDSSSSRRSRPVRMHGNVLPGALSSALARSVGSTLENLSLSLGYNIGRGWTINSENRALDLRGMSRLKHLSLSLASLHLIYTRDKCDHQTYRRLPPSLETLHVFTIPLLSVRGKPPTPFNACVYKRKAAHGLPNLKTIIYTYEYQAPSGRSSFGIINRPGSDLLNRIISASKERIRRRHIRNVWLYRKYDIRVKIEVEVTPPGFIPPYLNNEEQPVNSPLWDSAYMDYYVDDVQEHGSPMEHEEMQVSPQQAEEEDEEEEESDSGDDGGLEGINLIRLAPRERELLEVLVMQPGQGLPL